MKYLKILICGCFLMLMGCAASEPAPKRTVDTDKIRSDASQAYSELDAEQSGSK